DFRAAGDERVERARFVIRGRERGDGRRAELLRLRGEGSSVGERIGADVDDDLQRAAARDFAPALRERLAFFERKRAALAGAAADEDGGDAIFQKMRGLCLDGGEVQRAVGCERRVGGCDEAVEWMRGCHRKKSVPGWR